jgi:hypothetical protein
MTIIISFGFTVWYALREVWLAAAAPRSGRRSPRKARIAR